MTDPSYAYAYYEYTAAGQTVSIYGLLHTAQPSEIAWSFYNSYVAAPPNVFKKSLSTMLAVSQSWVANGAMLQNRLWENAAKMGVLASYVNSSGDEASAASSRVNLAWDLWAREHDIIEDTRDGTRSEVNTLHAQELVNQLNTREGNDRWRVVPMADYN